MSPPSLPTGWRLEVHPELASTADLLTERAAAGEPEGLAVLALRQTAGRGRAGRSWASPLGNLYLSMLLRPAMPAREASQWSLLAGVALIEAASALVADPAALRLKWPNDLLLNGAKCAGILAESALAADGSLAWLALGFGVNLAEAPSLPDRPTAHFHAAETPETFACRLLERLGYWRGLAALEGFSPVRQAWLRHGPPLGGMMTVRQPQAGPFGSLAGRFAGLAEDGALLLETSGTTRRITTGEVDGTG